MLRVLLLLPMVAGIGLLPLKALAQSASTPTNPGLAPWNLAQSIGYLLQSAPEIGAWQAQLQATRDAKKQAGLWPNPRLDWRSISSDSPNGLSTTEIELSQTLPLGRSGKQSQLAEEEARAAAAHYDVQRLQLAYDGASRFHALQRATAQLTLVEERLSLNRSIQALGRQRTQAGQLSQTGRLAQREQLRLEVLDELTHQAQSTAEGEYEDALGNFRARFGLPLHQKVTLVSLDNLPQRPSRAELEPLAQQHPYRHWLNQQQDVAQARINVARAERFADITLGLFQSSNSNDVVTSGLRINLPLPLWNRQQGHVAQARSQLRQSQYDARAQLRDWNARLEKAYEHLQHLIEQTQHHQQKVLHPAKRVYTLSQNSFHAGELDLTAFLDALETYYDAQERQLVLRYQTWMEAAELRLLSGLSLQPNS